MVAFIDAHRAHHGVESICVYSPIAPSSYYEHKAREADPDRRSPRAKRDQELMADIQRIWEDNFCVYGVRKVWQPLKRDKSNVARCTVARLMGVLGLKDAVRGKPHKTTMANEEAHRLADLVKRQFTADRPNQRWVADFTYVATWRGFTYVAFVIDVFSRHIVGWRASTSTKTDFVLDALEQALWAHRKPKGVIHHCDRGSQYLSIRYTERMRNE